MRVWRRFIDWRRERYRRKHVRTLLQWKREAWK